MIDTAEYPDGIGGGEEGEYEFGDISVRQHWEQVFWLHMTVIIIWK